MDYSPLAVEPQQYGIDFLRPFRFFTQSTERVYWEYLLTSFTLALFVFAIQRIREQGGKPGDGSGAGAGEQSKQPGLGVGQFFKEALPKEIYGHKSAIVDYFYFYVNTVFYPVLVPIIYLSAGRISGVVQGWLAEWLGEPHHNGSNNILIGIFYSIFAAALLDLALYVTHYLQHRIPVLWEFHKVHHSAEVLTPMTVYRMHPIDDIFALGTGAVFVGVGDAVFRFFCPQLAAPLTVAGLNIVIFLFYYLGYNLRHSHLWIAYPGFLSRIFISPAQHQIHHSDNPKHFDKNFGFIFAVWDWIFGSLYVPVGREKVSFGLGGEEKEYSTIPRLYLLPFKKAFLRVIRR